ATIYIKKAANIVITHPKKNYKNKISDINANSDLPVTAYNVSSEYRANKAAAKMGWIDETKVMMELLTSFKRAGADMILTYHAVEAAKVLNNL
ncbi:porphobilinogen synthase, partial [bacterium]|nr:porphobilinogen synthase [bacterium]